MLQETAHTSAAHTPETAGIWSGQHRSLTIDLVPHEESAAAAAARTQKRAWLMERDYRVVEIAAGEVEADPAAVIERLAQSLKL